MILIIRRKALKTRVDQYDMETPEDFMKRYFKARTEEFEREREARLPFRERFYTTECEVDSRALDVRRSEAEVIVELDSAGDEARVVTRNMQPLPPCRYTLVKNQETWMIKNAEFFYGGLGWLGLQAMKDKLRNGLDA
jgi:hypothetical protein